MAFYRYAIVVLMMFVCGEALAQTKVAKPKITRQPVSTTVDFGHTAVFSVNVSSPAPTTFQWRRNKLPIPDATDSSYEITTVFPEDAGKYDVVVTNAAGTAISKAATLVVNLAPASLPVDAVIYGDMRIRVFGQTEDSDGAFVVTGETTLKDPESPHDIYTFTYTRLPKNKATLVIRGSAFDSSLGGNITSVETYTLTFTGVSIDGERLATVSGKGTLVPPAGYRPAKVGFTASGTMSIEGTDLGGFTPSDGGSGLGGSVGVGW